MKLDDIISLAEAADELGIDPSGLRAQAAAGRLEAKLVGKTWITTRQEVERYRRDHLGQVGRPRSLAERTQIFLGDDERTDLRQEKVKPTREPGH